MNSRLQTVNIARRPGLAVDTLISGRYGLWLENISRIPGCPEVCCELVPACFTPYIIGGRSWHLSDYSVENTPEFWLAITAMDILLWKEQFLLGVVGNIFLSYFYYAEWATRYLRHGTKGERRKARLAWRFIHSTILFYRVAFGIINTQSFIFVRARTGYLKLMSLPRGLHHRESTDRGVNKAPRLPQGEINLPCRYCFHSARA